MVIIIQTFIISTAALVGMAVVISAIKEVSLEKEKTKQIGYETTKEISEKLSPSEIYALKKLFM